MAKGFDSLVTNLPSIQESTLPFFDNPDERKVQKREEVEVLRNYAF